MGFLDKKPGSYIGNELSYGKKGIFNLSARDIITNGLVYKIDLEDRNCWNGINNVHPYPTDIYAWIQGANAATLSRDTISSPVGNTPIKMAVTGDDPYMGSYNAAAYNLWSTAVGETWTVSVYAKASVNTTGEIFIFGADSAGTYLEAKAGSVNITTNWTRVSYTASITNANSIYFQTRLDGPNNGGAGITIWWDGLQAQKGPLTDFTNKPGYKFTDLVGSYVSNITDGVSLINNKIASFTESGKLTTNVNMSTTNHTLVSLVRKPDIADVGRSITATGNNYITGHHSTNYGNNYAEGGVYGGSGTNDGKWRIYTVTGHIANDNWTSYENIKKTADNNLGSQGPNNISINTYGTEISKVELSLLLVYNRQLTNQEVYINHIALKNRYSDLKESSFKVICG